MPLSSESVTLAGSGLVFINKYEDSVSPAYRDAIIAAEHDLQSRFTDSVSVNAHFDYAPLTGGFIAGNGYTALIYSYADFTAALRAHATTPDDLAAVAALPATDPSRGSGFMIPISQAVVLGLTPQANTAVINVTVNSNAGFTFGGDVIGALQHELTEGVFGRVAALGSYDTWAPLDLFRFTASGIRDYSGGGSGLTTYFGLSPTQVSAFAYHNAISPTGADDGQDLGDWESTRGDAFGPGQPGMPATMSATDLQVLDILGWTPTSPTTRFVPAADDFANTLSNSSSPIGAVAVGGSAAGTLQQAGDRDWFAVQLQAGGTYVLNMNGHPSGLGTVGDAYLRLRDASGALLASNDDIIDGHEPDSRILFTASTTGTYYLEAGGFLDGYAGTYRLSVLQAGVTAGAGDDVLQARAGATSLNGGTGNDILLGWAGGDVLWGGDGDDSIQGGAGFDDINGNKGNDTIGGGGAGSDWLVGGQGDDLIISEASDNVLLGNLGNDTLLGGSGTEVLRGGQGDDVLVAGTGRAWMSGDRGADTLVGGTGPDTYHSFSGAGLDLVLDFSSAKGDRVQLDPGTAYTVRQSGADTVVDMGGGDQLVLKSVQLSALPEGWIFLA